jgi:hypothetical protein
MHRSTVRLAFAPGRTWRGIAALLLLATQVAACYTTRPIEGAPKAGATVILEVNDRGRVELVDRVGQSVERIQGQLQSVTDSGYVLRVQSVRYLNGQLNQWSGEELTMPTAFVSRARQQEFSKTRTFLLAAGITAALVAVLVQLDLVGGGDTPRDGNPNKGGTPEA